MHKLRCACNIIKDVHNVLVKNKTHNFWSYLRHCLLFKDMYYTVCTDVYKSKEKYTDIAVRSLTCHTATGTHMPYRPVFPATRQTWHSRLYPSRSWYSIERPRRDARLSWPSWLVTYRDGMPVRRRSAIQVTCVNFVHATICANHYAVLSVSFLK